MSENVREATFEEYVTNIIMHILAIETTFGVKRDLISHILSLSYQYEREVAAAKRKNRNTGVWELTTLDDGYGEYQVYTHKACGCLAIQRWNYCPECGAAMQEER